MYLFRNIKIKMYVKAQSSFNEIVPCDVYLFRFATVGILNVPSNGCVVSVDVLDRVRSSKGTRSHSVSNALNK